jgi:hypothetical protein
MLRPLFEYAEDMAAQSDAYLFLEWVLMARCAGLRSEDGRPVDAVQARRQPQTVPASETCSSPTEAPPDTW